MIALLRQRNFALLWWGALISMLGDWMLATALPIYVYQLTGSAFATSLTFIARRTPVLLFGSLAGVFVDRWDRKRVMVVCNLLLALSLLPLILVRSADMVWLVYLVAFAQTTINLFFGPAENALLPQVVEADRLIAANGLNSLNNNLARLIGPPLGGAVVVFFNLPGVVIIDAATYLAAAALIGLVSVAAPAAATPDAAPDAGRFGLIWQQLGAGLRLLVRQRTLVTIGLVLAISSIGEGVFSVMFLLWVSQLLGGGAPELGWFYGAQAIGGIIGGLAVGAVGRRIGPARLLGLSTIAFGLLDLALFNYPRVSGEIVIGLALMVLVGVPSVGYGAGMLTLQQLAVEDRYRGRIFGALSTLSALCYLISVTVTGLIGEALGPLIMLNIQGGSYVLAGIFTLVMLRNWRH